VKTAKAILLKSLLLQIIFVLTMTSVWADITGTVYKDFNMNGTQDDGDAPVIGALVKAVCTDEEVYTDTTDANGSYALSGMPSGAKCRVEADVSSAGLGSGTNAPGSAPLVDIVADGSTHNISAGSPATYCQPNPDVVLAATAGWFTDDDDERQSPEGFGTIFKVPTPAEGDFNNDDTIDDKRDVITKSEDTGAIWGAAWKKSTQELFVSAAIKRYVPLKDEATKPADAAGSIYKVKLDGSLELFAVIDDVVTSDDENIIKNRTYDENEDTDIKELVGAKGLGDLDISEDDKYLYTINLKNKTLIKLDASSGDILATASIPNPYGSECTDEKVRPWALKIRGNDVFIGSVCEDEILDGDDPTDMEAGGIGAAIQKFDGSEFTNFAMTNTLRFLRPKGYNPKDETSYHYQNTDWSHGSYEWLPQPMLTDIEFANNGDLVLGYTDRSIMIRERSGSHGDIRKMCLNDDGTYTDESTARVETDCASTKIEYEDNDEDYYEFYVGDYFNGYLGEDGHPETASGALAQAPGQDNIIVGMVDGTDWYQPGSIGLYSHTSGDKIAAQAVIKNDKTTDGGEREPFGSKAGGMGDVELLCDPAPIELGNYVWMDLNEDGIQDPNEPPFKEVNVTLSCGDPQVEYGVALTDKNGHYYFGGLDNVNLNDGKTISADLSCELSIKKSDVNDKDASEQNVNGDDNDTIDNDAAADGDYNKFTFTTTASSDHSLDFGILPARGCVTGKLFEDVNEDGIFNDTDVEAPAHITLNVKDAYGNTYTTETDENGDFTLENVLAGDVTLSIDTSDTDIPDGSVWSEPGSSVTITLSEGTSADGTCSDKDFPYTIPGEKDRDPKDVAVCANPTSITWEGSNVSSATVWHDLLDGDLTDVETVSGNTVTVSMHIDNPDTQFYDTDADNDSGSGTSAAFGEPYLTLYLGDQTDPGDGNWNNDDGAGCTSHGYELESGQKSVLTVDFNTSVVLDNWRIRDVDSGDVRGDASEWEWQDGIEVVAYDENDNEVAIETKIGDSGTGLIQDENAIVHTDKDEYDAGEGDFITGEGTTPNATNGHIVLTSNFVPIKKLVITHSAGPDVPCQTRSALAMTGFAVCKPLHIKGTVYDDKDGTDQADCDTNDDIDGEVISEIDGKALNACLLDDDGVVVATQVVVDGAYDFFTNIHPNTMYGMLLTTDECIVGNDAPSAVLSEGWKYEGETYTTSPDGDLDGYVDVQVETEDIDKLDFAINKVPTANAYQREIELNPGDEVQVDFITDGTETAAFIDDFEQSTEVSIRIVRISGGKLYYDGSEVAEDDMIVSPDFANFKIDPDDGDVKTTFTYTVVDQACRESNEALFEAPFNTVFISGKLFYDSTRNDTVDGEGVQYSCDGTTELYINLVDTDNKVVASKALDEEGNYGFYSADGLEDNTDYTLILSQTEGSKGDDAPSAVLPGGCVNADGENIGASEGTDDNADGIIVVSVKDENIDEINFAITSTVKVGNLVWIEDDNDGNASTGNVTPVENHTVTISCENGYEAETTTNSDGIYEFTLLSNTGECTVKTDTPSETSPADGSDDNDVDDTTSEENMTHDATGTTVNVNTKDHMTVDFGFISAQPEISGTLFDDGNGNGNVDGTAIDSADGEVIYVTLLDEDGIVMASRALNSDGTYLFTDEDGIHSNRCYTVMISTNSGTEGESAPSVVLPAHWNHTGENLNASGDGTDGAANGKIKVCVEVDDVPNVDLGINKAPVSEDITADTEANRPNDDCFVVPTLVYSDKEDGKPNTIELLTLPNNATLYYNGALVNVGDVINDFDNDLLCADPYDPTTNVTFDYDVIDKSSVKSNVSTVIMPFYLAGKGRGTVTPAPTPAPQPSVSVTEVSDITVDSAVLHWSDNTSDEYGYKIYDLDNNLIAVVGANVTSYTLENLEVDTSYVFKILSFNGRGEGVKQLITFKTLDPKAWLIAVRHVILF
jgi:hypothetical protein